MSTPPKLQMSDIPQELIDQLKDLVRLELKQEIKQEIKQEVMEEVRVELQKKEPPRDVLVEALGALYALIMRTSSRAHAKQE
ncbi:hypothetical protein CHLRE_02g074550v5 [Chlamydomonas reinhardtii]|uniref:Uncharacterized protein n=1 Tax=Chlamydomonas reinhardtii TaxID=3055 RepID=A8I9X1_CHLRE|nr:uncharacterized protein CHLRE_02g074550v5 [Chlamydomonas reinhardtii]PNW86133.1 hypothetical protein CHLRE_02g074550v5 [Chlamydomonas reinhardtii]|eukprot:XP_001701625.1 predicted protein [Chlamydomonas reinhardtii]